MSITQRIASSVKRRLDMRRCNGCFELVTKREAISDGFNYYCNDQHAAKRYEARLLGM